MERSLLWSACALGGAGLVCCLLLAARPPERERADGAPSRFALVAAALLPLLVFAATLPAEPPFSAGQGWGRGFLLGGLGAWLSGWITLRAGGRGAAALAAPCWMALCAVAATLLFAGRDAVIDSLLGVAIGWFTICFLLGVAGRAGDLLPLALGAGYAVTLCAAAALGVYRDLLSPDLARGTWSALATVLAAGVPFALLLGGALPGARGGIWLRIPLAFAVFTGLAAALSFKVVPERAVLFVAVLGLALGAMAWWIFRDAHARSDEEAAPFWLPPLALALLLGGFMAAYQMLQGFGVGLMLIAAVLPASFALLAAAEADDERAAVASAVTRLLLAGAILLLYRLFATRFAHDLRGVTLTDHYALFGFLLGAALPGLLAGLTSRLPLTPAPSAGEGAGVRGIVLAGAATLAAPGVVVLLWGAKCALALFAGLALGAAGGFETRRAGGAALGGIVPALLAVGVALALAQWTGHVLPLADMTRAAKIRVLAGVIGALIALVAVSDYGGRLRGRALR